MKKLTAAILTVIVFFSMVLPVLAADSPLWAQSKIEGKLVYDSAKNVYKILNLIKAKRSRPLENNMNEKYVKPIVKDAAGMREQLGAMINFVTYGTPSTLKTGAKERAGAILSYRQAFNNLPILATEWTDVILICNGSRPLGVSLTAESAAKKEFRRAYGREAFLTNKNDYSAVMIIAYGVRPIMSSAIKEKAAILHFEKIYGYKPILNNHWDTVRAFAYSGVKY